MEYSLAEQPAFKFKIKHDMIRVCVVGAGPAGLCAARHLAEDTDHFEFKVYEQQGQVGGAWVYTERTGSDEYGFPVHSSMYKNLKTTLPVQILNFPDFPYKEDKESYVGHVEVLTYLQDYAKHFNLLKHIKFHHRVQNIRLEDSRSVRDLWLIEVLDGQTGIRKTLEFDAVMICAGTYSKPRFPDIPGLDKFNGRVLHSHDFRGPEPFAGQDVVVLGAAASGMDIALELLSQANKVILSHNKDKRFHSKNIPDRLTEAPGIASLQGSRVQFLNEESVQADTILLCTGYNHTAPDLLDASVGLSLKDRRIATLYKHLIHVPHPSLAVFGVTYVIVPFPLFNQQVQFLLSVWRGRTKLPTKNEMMEDIERDFKKRLDLGWPARYAHVMIGDFQWHLVEDMENLAKMSKLSPHYREIHAEVFRRRFVQPYLYKKDRIVLHEDNTFQFLDGSPELKKDERNCNCV